MRELMLYSVSILAFFVAASSSTAAGVGVVTPAADFRFLSLSAAADRARASAVCTVL